MQNLNNLAAQLKHAQDNGVNIFAEFTTPKVQAVKDNIIEALLRTPGDEWVTLPKIESYTDTASETVLNGLRSLYRENRIEHRRDAGEDFFKVANVKTEIARIDAEWIRTELRLQTWRATGEDFYKCVAVPTEHFWHYWKRNRKYIKDRQLIVDHNKNGSWRVYCYNPELSTLLTSS